MRHIAFSIKFDDLLEGLFDAESRGYVNVTRREDIALFNYSKTCTFDKAWNVATRSARGLILDLKTNTVASLGLAKFFNYGENPLEPIPNEPHRVYPKMDGSCVQLYFCPLANDWRFNTRGSFDSEQAIEAQAIFDENRPIKMYAILSK